MIRIFKRSLSKDLRGSKGIWSDFSKRSGSLRIQTPTKVPTLPNYHSPNLIDETFEKAYDLLQQDSETIYNKLNTKDLSEQEKESLAIKAEETNPEVLYNLQYGDSSKFDVSEPIYRNHLYKKWQEYDLLVLMQRLEQFKVIPDTLPTLEPKIDVKVKFPTNNPDFANWVTPGEMLPSFLTKYPPVMKLQLFDQLPENVDNQLFTVVLVNPDEPDLSTNSFTTTLHYGLSNVPINLADNTIDVGHYLKASEESPFTTFKSYQPVLPEVNAGAYQRCCLWVFKHNDNKPVDINVASSQNFDIRQFANTYNLTAVGAHMWRQVYDRSVNEVRTMYGLPKGRVFHRVRKPYPLK